MITSKVNNFIHDLNQPLQIIIGSTNVCLLDIKDNDVDLEKLEKQLDDIKNASNRIIELTHQLQYDVNK